MTTPQYCDLDGHLVRWIEDLVLARPTDTLFLLQDISNGVFTQISYQSCGTEGTQSPVETVDVEAEDIAGRALPTATDTAEFAASLVQSGVAEAVIFARGAEGSVLATATGAWLARPAPVEEVSKVGAGDSFVGAFTLALARGQAMPEALRYGVAASAAAVATEATRLCPLEDVTRLLPDCSVERLVV